MRLLFKWVLVITVPIGDSNLWKKSNNFQTSWTLISGCPAQHLNTFESKTGSLASKWCCWCLEPHGDLDLWCSTSRHLERKSWWCCLSKSLWHLPGPAECPYQSAAMCSACTIAVLHTFGKWMDLKTLVLKKITPGPDFRECL